MRNTPPPPPPQAKEKPRKAKERKPWVKPVLSAMVDVPYTNAGAKTPTPLSYEGLPTGAPAPVAPPNPYQTYGPFQNI